MLNNFIFKLKILINERRLPYGFLRYPFMLPFRWIYIMSLRAKTNAYNAAQATRTIQKKGKNLYSSPVGKEGKAHLKKIIHKFGHDDFDYIIFVYDDTKFEEPIFNKCKFIYEKAVRWQYMRKYITPSQCAAYDYIFLWPDDIDPHDFSWRNFINIMERNHLQVAQPALAYNSYVSFKITRQDPKYSVGRYTDYVENMSMIFTQAAWVAFWNLMEPDFNFWGWGYDWLAKSLCGYTNMGIVDCEPVEHTKPFRSKNTQAPAEMKRFFKQYRGVFFSQQLTYMALI